MRVLRLFCSWRKYFFWGNTISSLALLFFASRLDTLIEQTGWVARIVLCILLILSVYSWAIIFKKSGQFSRILQVL